MKPNFTRGESIPCANIISVSPLFGVLSDYKNIFFYLIRGKNTLDRLLSDMSVC